MRNPRPLTNNTVLITGAASGIGRSLCHGLGEQGASLALLDRNGCALDDLAGELAMAGIRFSVAVADVRDRPCHGEAVDALVRELGPMVSMEVGRMFGSIETATAAAKITQAILKRQRVCCFPLTTTLLVHGARLLPAAALDWIRDRFAGRIPVANARKPFGVRIDHAAAVR